jgi:cytochrome c553
MKKLILLTALLASGVSAFAADVDAGKSKSVTCAGCHGATGISAVPMYPNLAGQKALYVEKQLKAFRNGTRKDPIMGPMAKPLSDTDIVNIAAYFESL